MRRAAVLLVALLAGCAEPAAAPVLSAPIGEDSSAPTRADCPAPECAREWWNLTVRADAPYELRVPLPLVWAHPPPFPVDQASWWTGPLRAEGDGAAHIVWAQDAQVVVVTGEGDVEVRMQMVRAPQPGRTPDEFLLARWGAGADLVRPTLLHVDANGTPDVALAYEARSGLCERRAAFASEGAPVAGRLALAGSDGAWCA